MRTVSRQIRIWMPPGQQPREGLLALAAEAGARGGSAAVARWQADHPGTAITYAHGQRHDLWWEFQLAASFRWQAHVSRLNPGYGRQRLVRLAGLFGLSDLLGRRVETLTAAERSRANLAVALLPQPDVLVWEDPGHGLSETEWIHLSRTVRRHCRTEGLTVVMIAEEGTPHVCEDEVWPDRPGDGSHAWGAGDRAASAGPVWP